MIEENIIPLAPLNRAERNVKAIVISILSQFGLYATGNEIQDVLQ
ncbi:MAG: hypothetical protein ABW148_10235 [Sedimenticola sp.]